MREMAGDQDIRARALVDQLSEIDRRLHAASNWKTSWKQRTWHIVLCGILLALVARTGSDLVPLIVALTLLPPASEPVIRHFMTRRLERERDRVFNLCEEIDRRAAFQALEPKEENA